MRPCASCLCSVGFGKRVITRQTGIPETSVRRIKKASITPSLRRPTGNFFIQFRPAKQPTRATQLTLGIEIDDRTIGLCRTKHNKLRYRRRIKTERRRSRERAKKRWRDVISKTPELKLLKNLRRRIWKVMSGRVKASATLQLTGCTIEELKAHIESQFDSQMSWANYGSYWHVDHIKPCSSFDLSQPDQQRACFHWSNLQPLEASENISKNAKLDWIPRTTPRLGILFSPTQRAGAA